MNIGNLVGFILPPLIDLINKRIANHETRFFISMLICALVGVIINLDKIREPWDLIANASVVFASAQITYNAYWKRSDTRTKMFDEK